MTRFIISLIAITFSVGCADSAQVAGQVDKTPVSGETGEAHFSESGLEMDWSLNGGCTALKEYGEDGCVEELSVDGEVVEAWSCEAHDVYDSDFGDVIAGTDPASLCDPIGYQCMNDDCSTVALEQWKGWRNVIIYRP